MDLVTFKTLIDDCADRCGLLQADGSILLGNAGFVRRMIEKRLRQGWRFFAWPALCPVERRYYRPAYEGAATYNTGDEVWDGTTELYYRALADGVTGIAVSDATKWLPLNAEADPPLNRYVALRQAGMTPIGEVFAATTGDPATSRNPGDVPHRLSDFGVQFGPDAPAFAWLHFRRTVPRFTLTAWSAGTHAADVLIYHAATGDCWLSLEAGNTAAPGSDATKWEKQIVPAFLHDFVVEAVFADWLEDDGQTSKSASQDADAVDLLADERDQVTKQQGQTQRYRVRVR